MTEQETGVSQRLPSQNSYFLRKKVAYDGMGIYWLLHFPSLYLEFCTNVLPRALMVSRRMPHAVPVRSSHSSAPQRRQPFWRRADGHTPCAHHHAAAPPLWFRRGGQAETYNGQGPVPRPSLASG